MEHTAGRSRPPATGFTQGWNPVCGWFRVQSLRTSHSVTPFSGNFGRTAQEPAGVVKFHATGTRIGHCFGVEVGATSRSGHVDRNAASRRLLRKQDQFYATTATHGSVLDTHRERMFDVHPHQRCCTGRHCRRRRKIPTLINSLRANSIGRRSNCHKRA